MGAPDLAKHALLALHLLFELGDEDSRSNPYLATLPKLAGRESPSVPLLWTPVQVAALRGTPTHAAVLSRAKFVEAAHEALFPGGQGVPLDAFAWALSSVLSRAASGAGMPYTLMPGIDLLNHGGDRANCALGATRTGGFGVISEDDVDGGDAAAADGIRVDTGFGDIEVRCTRDVAPGEQLTISYGDNADNDRLLRLYGFAVPGNPNERRQLELRVTGHAAECWNMTNTWGPGLSMARQAILRMHGLPRLHAFVDHGAEEEIDEKGAQDLIDEVMKAMDQDDGSGVQRMTSVFRDPDFCAPPPPPPKSSPSSGSSSGASGRRKMHTSDSSAAHGHSHGGVECHGHGHGGGDNGGGGGGGEDSGGGGGAGGREEWAKAAAEAYARKAAEGAKKETKKDTVLTWRCYVAHPSKQFPPRRHKPMDSSTDAAQAATDAATALAGGVGGGAVSAEVLLASLRVHLLRGDEPPGPDGNEPNPW